MNSSTRNPNADLEYKIRQQVKQEIKNNDDELRYIKQELVKLSYEVINLKKENQRIESENTSDIVAYKVYISTLEKKYDEIIKDHTNKIDDIIECVKYIKKTYKEEIDILKEKKASTHEMMIYRNDLYNKMKFVLDKVESHKSDLQTSTTIINEKIKSTAEDVRNSIPEKPDLESIKENIQESYENIALDIRALVKEIEILKHHQKYNEKKFENVYTLIERLKSKVST